MGIQSTISITRIYAISRIIEIANLVEDKDYLGIDEVTSERDINISHFVNREIIDCDKINKWTDKMLEDKMDEPFYRYSIFDNYLIK